MKEEDLQRVRDIGSKRKWRNVDVVETEFLTADEVVNLTIHAGTLTLKERDIINHHIVATIKMLEQLPWPKHLTRVPEYAGGHHERMDGKGYPKGLTREQMSVQARMMGIADIFEALTARDRPYKHGMKLSQAMGIMGNFKKGGHIDSDLFDVFVRQGVYRAVQLLFCKLVRSDRWSALTRRCLSYLSRMRSTSHANNENCISQLNSLRTI